MTFSAGALTDREGLPPSRIVFTVTVLAIGALAGAELLYGMVGAGLNFSRHVNDIPVVAELSPAAVEPLAASNPFGELVASAFPPVVAPKRGPLEARFIPQGFFAPQTSFVPYSGAGDSVSPAAPSDGQTAENVPLPVPRPPELRSSSRPISIAALPQEVDQPKPVAPSDTRNFFEKLLGGGTSQSQQPVPGALAYAAPDDAELKSPRISAAIAPRYDRSTAVYDISARTVYMPNGARLEAHSGLGELLDDPRYVSERNRGATPPQVYDLSLREQAFHGVQALRMNPVGGLNSVYGRTGLLAHTFMMGPKGDSNGCVSFKDYDTFLQAYRNGEVKRLAVVSRLE